MNGEKAKTNIVTMTVPQRNPTLNALLNHLMGAFHPDATPKRPNCNDVCASRDAEVWGYAKKCVRVCKFY